MDSFEIALAHSLVQKKGFTWYPPGVLFPELSLFKSHSGRGTLVRLLHAEQLVSFDAVLDQSFQEVKEILQDHPYQSITLIHFYIYSTSPDENLKFQLRKLGRYQTAPDIAAYTVWFDLQNHQFDSNIPWYDKAMLPKSIVQAAADLATANPTPEALQAQIEQTLVQRQDEWKTIYTQESSKAVNSLLLIIIGMFLWMLTQGSVEADPEILYRFGAKVNEAIVAGEYWRLLAPIFLHASFLHLLVNSFALYSLRNVEWIYGSNRFLLIFLLAGISGNIASFAASPYGAVGASGSIFGLLGALLYFGRQRREFFQRTMGSAVWSTLIINLILGFLLPQVSNSGHIGGLIGGFSAAAALGLPAQAKGKKQILAGLTLILLAIAGIRIGFFRWS